MFHSLGLTQKNAKRSIICYENEKPIQIYFFSGVTYEENIFDCIISDFDVIYFK